MLFKRTWFDSNKSSSYIHTNRSELRKLEHLQQTYRQLSLANHIRSMIDEDWHQYRHNLNWIKTSREWDICLAYLTIVDNHQRQARENKTPRVDIDHVHVRVYRQIVLLTDLSLEEFIYFHQYLFANGIVTSNNANNRWQFSFLMWTIS